MTQSNDIPPHIILNGDKLLCDKCGEVTVLPFNSDKCISFKDLFEFIKAFGFIHRHLP